MKKILIAILPIVGAHQFAQGQNYSEILGRPTDTSITMSIRFDQPTEVYWEYGTSSGSYGANTANYQASTDIPLEVDFRNLLTNKKYFYRTRYRSAGTTGSFTNGQEHSFQTRRAVGNSFSFVVEADPHLDTNTNPAAYKLTLQHMLSKKPDFMVDLGDNFMSEKLPTASQNQTEITSRHALFRPYFGELCHSAPLFITMGNHEGELGWLANTSASSLPAMATNTRKLFYPNPFPNGFYSGNNTPENFVGLRENYYAWEWGDALFIVIDPYWHTKTKPGWGWTLGTEQYNWFKNVITSSKAKFKFVFSHQLVGGNGNDARGGVEYASLFEMGGYNLDGTYGFDTYRPGWQKPIHQLMKENGGSIFFHGHDHFFAKQDQDSIVYQEVPQPSAKNITNVTGTEPGYGYVSGLLLANRGYMYVTVTPDSVKVDYIKTYLPTEENATRHNGDIAYSYTIKKSASGNIINNKDLVNVYPNPANTKITVQLLEAVTNYQSKLINAAGQVVLKANTKELDVKNIASGVYFLDIETEKFRVNKKIVIRH